MMESSLPPKWPIQVPFCVRNNKKNPIFYWYLRFFLSEAVEASLCYIFENWLIKYKSPILLKPLGTIIHQNSQFYHPSEPFSFHHFNVRHPVHMITKNLGHRVHRICHKQQRNRWKRKWDGRDDPIGKKLFQKSKVLTQFTVHQLQTSHHSYGPWTRPNSSPSCKLLVRTIFVTEDFMRKIPARGYSNSKQESIPELSFWTFFTTLEPVNLPKLRPFFVNPRFHEFF